MQDDLAFDLDDDPANNPTVGNLDDLAELCQHLKPYQIRRKPNRYTEAPPGSEAKIRVFQARFAAGVDLFRDDDLQADQIAVGQEVVVGNNGHAKRLTFKSRDDAA